jgi:hypothetical protein
VNSIGAGAHGQLDPRLQKTFDYAIEVTKQLLTLGSAVLALTLTVAKEAPNGRRGFMLAGWFAFLLSVIFGIVSLYTLMREFAPRSDGRDDPPSIGSWRVRGPLLLQIVTFALGAVFVVAYAYSVWKRL